MEQIRPIFKNLLFVALAVFVVGTSILLSQLCYKVGKMEHIICHLTGEHPGKL